MGRAVWPPASRAESCATRTAKPTGRRMSSAACTVAADDPAPVLAIAAKRKRCIRKVELGFYASPGRFTVEAALGPRHRTGDERCQRSTRRPFISGKVRHLGGPSAETRPPELPPLESDP